MGCYILCDAGDNMAVLYCSTSDWAFGPVFYEGCDHDADERAAAFMRWLKTAPGDYETVGLLRGDRDPRSLTEGGLARAYSDWLAQEATQWQAEEDLAHNGG